MKKKKSSIIKLSVIGVLLVLGILISFVPMNFGLTTFRSTASSISLGLDLKGGVFAVYECDSDNSGAIAGTRTRLENLLIDKNYTEATVVREGSKRLRVEVPDVDDPKQIFEIIGKPAELSFVLDETGETVITGRNVKKASVGMETSGEYVVQLTLDADGTTKFSNATRDNIDKTMSIIVTVDGEPKTISSPKIESHIPNGKAVINGMESREAAQNLVDQIISGQFEVKLSLLESSTISPTLGRTALKLGLIAGIVGMILVMLFMCWIYRMMGVVASIALGFYIILMFFFLAVIPGVQLTLPGIAGIILGIGMAVDANVIIYERIKDEYRNGKSILASYYAGVKKAFWTIFDSNITTIIAAVVLWIFGTGSIQGFAITLFIGIILSLLSAVVITRFLLKQFLNINSTNEKLYNLKRGKEFIDVGADSSAEGVETEPVKKENRFKKKGGLADENV